EDPPHQPRRDCKEMCPVLPADPPNVDQPQIRLVHERGGLEHMPGTLGPHFTTRQTSQLVLDQRQQSVQCVMVALGPTREKGRDLLRGYVCHGVRVAGCPLCVKGCPFYRRTDRRRRDSFGPPFPP